MVVPAVKPASAGVTILASDLMFEVDTAYNGDTAVTPAWLGVFAVNSFSPGLTPGSGDSSTFDDGLYGSSFVNSLAGTWNLGMERKLFAGGAFDAGQEFILSKAIPADGSAPKPMRVRYFSRSGLPGGKVAVVLPGWTDPGGGPKDSLKASATFTLQGPPTSIVTNPMTVDSAPVIVSATPSGAVTGALVRINGTYLFSVTSVLFGAVPAGAGNFNATSDQTIIVKVPAGSAGAANITLVNAAGTSNSLPFTRGA